MSVASWVNAKLFGNLITELGSVKTSRKSDKWRLTLSLYQKGGQPTLVFKWKQGGETSWMTIDAEPSVLEKLERMIQNARAQARSIRRA